MTPSQVYDQSVRGGTCSANVPNVGLQTPVDQATALVVLPQFEQRCVDAFRKYAEAKRALEQARGELAVVKDIAAGEFDDAGSYAIGSHGSWRVD